MIHQSLKGVMGMDKTCSATITFGDDEGDNICTFGCMLPMHHVGLHVEFGRTSAEQQDTDLQPYVLTWGDPQDD